MLDSSYKGKYPVQWHYFAIISDTSRAATRYADDNDFIFVHVAHRGDSREPSADIVVPDVFGRISGMGMSLF